MQRTRNIAEIFAFIFVLLIGVVALLMIGAASSAAQPADLSNSTADGERIDEHTIVTDKSYNADTGEVTISLYSAKRQRISISDAGALFAGKEIASASTFTVPDDHINLTVSVTPMNGQIAVALTTEKTQKGLLVDKDTFLVRGPWDSLDTQITGAAGLTSGLFVTFFFAWRRSSSSAVEPEQKL